MVNVAARKKLVQEYYSRRAEDYDKQKIRTWESKLGFGDKVFEDLIDSLAGLDDKHVLEACAGTGRTSLPLLERARPWLVGLDFSKEMLKVASAKLSPHRMRFNLVLGDAEHLPFEAEIFDALICMSALHYFAFPGRCLAEFLRVLHVKGVFVFGDLTLHQGDGRRFLNKLERTVSYVHEGYMKPSEIKNKLENIGFSCSSMNTVAHRKTFDSLIEDKARYFGVKPEAIHQCIEDSSLDEKKMYALDSDGLTLYYTLITSVKEA
jgi:ubiquinone/menaquinone biosynthesis C-methylase UbiE